MHYRFFFLFFYSAIGKMQRPCTVRKTRKYFDPARSKYRLTYLPLNGFVSRPFVYFHSNPKLNYFSYPMFRQILCNPVNRNIQLAKDLTNSQIMRDSKNVQISILLKEGEKSIIELPRQLMRVHTIDINEPVTLWELAVRRTYTYRR